MNQIGETEQCDLGHLNMETTSAVAFCKYFGEVGQVNIPKVRFPQVSNKPKERKIQIISAWKAKCPIFKAIVAGFRGKVALKNRTLGVPGVYFRSTILSHGLMAADGDPSFQKA